MEVSWRAAWYETNRWHNNPGLLLRLLAVTTGCQNFVSQQLGELNAELARSNEELDASAYVASHDLKEPLRGVSNYANQLLERAAAVDGNSRKRLEGLMRLTVRMDMLLDSLLHFSRVGRATLNFEPVNLHEVVEEAAEIVAARRQEVPTS
ncbi:MAG: hypothetical protein JWL59_3682 [Chthoniobacteraceae bacterium]|nr:hypothetical protein [Chthoniobacteraceae bacterium]